MAVMETATSRFFAIEELIEIFLHSADLSTLMNCQRVCQLWHSMIKTSDSLQQRLFLAPDTNAADLVVLNPVLHLYFRSILGPSETTMLSDGTWVQRTALSSYDVVCDLPWSAEWRVKPFARPEASWREMLVSQPPILRFDHYHDWECSERHPQNDQWPKRKGGGHQYIEQRHITIGMLWDLMEARLLRGCVAQVSFFTGGGTSLHDPLATEQEVSYVKRGNGHPSRKNLDTSKPQVVLRTAHQWPNTGPLGYQEYDVARRTWIILPEPPSTSDSLQEAQRYRYLRRDGFKWLNEDCIKDLTNINTRRWSKSEAFRWPALGNPTVYMIGGFN